MRLRWPAAWAPAAKRCDCGDGPGSTPGGDVRCPPPSSPLGAGKRRHPSLGALCRRQGLRGQINGRPGGGPMALRLSAHRRATAACRGPSGSDAGWPGCASFWRRCTRSSRIRSASIGNGPGPQRVSGALVGVGAGVGVGAVPPLQLAPTHVYPFPYAPTSPPSFAAVLPGEPDCK